MQELRIKINPSLSSYKQLKSEDDLRRLFFLTVQTSQEEHSMPFKPRWINRLYAHILGYFWLPCNICGKNYGGHETYGSSNITMTTICPTCTLRTYNKTGSFTIKRENQ